ncbi:hypothetical protein [Streptomyces orinoci]|uniref:Uncharacterized protein n=1 Tax=Streptomyces orinoci TaxID=67339 RepID=A0ABV3K6L0_STRON|nr:hypothetical protein [Streptomyces orinoci]
MVHHPMTGREAAPTAPPAPDFERARAVADAVLYEGYLLYPYRGSSGKNRVRWQFGVLAPRAWAEACAPGSAGVAGAAESWRQRTEVVVRADSPDAMVHVRVRFLQLQHRQVERQAENGRLVPVAALETPGAVYLTFDEAVPRQADAAVRLAGLLRGEHRLPVRLAGGEEAEELYGAAGRLVRRRWPVEAEVVLSAAPLDMERCLYRLTVRTENTGDGAGPQDSRERALRHALLATHTLIGGGGLCFASPTDPPAWAGAHPAKCRNLHTFPVLAGEPGSCDLVLSAPVILPDHPQVAPESPGDLHDAAEIDEILTLRTLLLTDAEKREARGTDRRAAEILDRVESMPPEVLSRLHGAIRSLTPPAGKGVDGPWWTEDAEGGLCPATDSVLVGGVPVARGSRVRLCPRGRGVDAQDMFLAGRTAQVAAVFHDVDGSHHIAVTLEEDPGAELHGWYGRFRYFRPEEIESLPAVPAEEGCVGRHRVAEA